MKIKNNVVPKIEPWGTPEITVVKSASPFSLSIVCCREHKYDLNHSIEEESNLYKESLCNRILWSTRSNALRKSIKRAPTISSLSIHSIQSSISLTKAVWQLCLGLNPDWFSCRILYLLKNAIRCLLRCFFNDLWYSWQYGYRPIVRRIGFFTTFMDRVYVPMFQLSWKLTSCNAFIN